MSDDNKPDLMDWLGLRWEPDYSKTRWLGRCITAVFALLVLFLVVPAVLEFFRAVTGLDSFETEEAQSTAIRNTGLVLAAVIGVPFIVWRSIVAQKTVNVTEQGHITDRINTAVQGLGAEKVVKLPGEDEKTVPNLEVRIGAIYALERIAQDSDRDHVQIMEILCAYIRQNAPAPAEDDWPELEMRESEDDGPLEEDWDDRLEAFRTKQEEVKATLTCRTDIQTALTVIGRRSAEQRQIEAGARRGEKSTFPFDTPYPEYDEPEGDHHPGRVEAYKAELQNRKWTLRGYARYRLDLRNTNLQGADLSGLELRGAKLDGARLQGANLRQARLQGADLRWARLQGADLRDARLQGADLGRARVQGADLEAAWLQGAELWQAGLQGAVLRTARLQGVVLRAARLQGANLGQAGLQGADFRQTRLQGAELWQARLQEAELWQAGLQGAFLGEARLDAHTDLTEATLRSAAVRSVDYTNIPQIAGHLADMFGDGSVKLPTGVDWPAHWPKHALGNDFPAQWREWQADPEGYTPPDPPDVAG